MKKRETASKVDYSGGFSEVDAKGSFSFFHCASVGVSKDLRCFLLFPLRTVRDSTFFFKKVIDPVNAAFKMNTIAALEEALFQS
ncbi:hypothetical protein [Brevibacillus sp. MS2.2]|uniref:hypothetical protein n=1 Tax=Brevibacillus sp. MS2.2 TaxID=2738981 RepID=UPI0020C4E67E|nr:hypothetical protein [Brevibacillus sp. MS2.2]